MKKINQQSNQSNYPKRNINYSSLTTYQNNLRENISETNLKNRRFDFLFRAIPSNFSKGYQANRKIEVRKMNRIYISLIAILIFLTTFQGVVFASVTKLTEGTVKSIKAEQKLIELVAPQFPSSKSWWIAYDNKTEWVEIKSPEDLVGKAVKADVWENEELEGQIGEWVAFRVEIG